MINLKEVAAFFFARGADFVSPPEEIAAVFKTCHAYLFDWDGVWNRGEKGADGVSPYSEPDSMGLNLLRFAYWLQNDKLPYVAIITGEPNPAAISLARREHFHAVYYKMKDKKEAWGHLTYNNKLQADSALYVWDDVLDLNVAAEVGLSLMCRRGASPMLERYARDQKVVDYITAHTGGEHAVREVCELLMGLVETWEAVVHERAQNSPRYQAYLYERNQLATHFYTRDEEGQIVEASPALGPAIKGLGV